jgi:hypothetical protein
MVFNTTVNNISVISWRSDLLVEETTDLSQVTDNLYHIMLYQIHLAMSVVQTHNVSGDCTGSCKSNYHAITTTTASIRIIEHNKEHNIYNVGNLGPGLEQAHNVAGLYQLIGTHTPPPLNNCLLQCYTS